MMRKARAGCGLYLMALVACGFPIPAVAADAEDNGAPATAPDRNLWRFELDNDFFTRVDSAFSAGWSLQRHTFQHAGWSEMNPSIFSAHISYYWYRDNPFEVANPRADLRRGNITLEYRLSCSYLLFR